MKKRFKKENVLMQMWGSLLMSTVLSIVMPLIANGAIRWFDFWTGFLISFFASLALKLLTPVIEIGQYLAEKLGVRPRTLSYRLLSTVFLALMMGTAMSLLMTWWGVCHVPGYWSFYLQSWLHEYPWVLLTVYLMINISIPTGEWLVLKRREQASSADGGMQVETAIFDGH